MGMSIGGSRGYSAPISRPVTTQQSTTTAPPKPQPSAQNASNVLEALLVNQLNTSGPIGTKVNKSA